MAKIADLTPGERLLIYRRRRDESQEQAARRLNITRNVYGRLERDCEDWQIHLPKMRELQIHEKCLLVRRRNRKTQEEIAAEIGVTRFWMNQMETGKGSCDCLAEFWGLGDEG